MSTELDRLSPVEAIGHDWASPEKLERHFALNDRHDAALRKLRAAANQSAS